jgi:membrane protease YdiL (CAAX protease family)
MWLVLPYFLPLGVIVSANLGVSRRRWRLLTYVALGLLNAMALVIGSLSLLLPYALMHLNAPAGGVEQAAQLQVFGLALAVAATFGLIVLLRPVRQALARWLPVDPDSPVHSTALVFSLYLAITSLSLLSGSEQWLLSSLESIDLDAAMLLSSQAVLVLMSLAGVGLGVRRNLRQTMSRLGLTRPSLPHLTTAVLMVGAMLLLDYVVSLLWRSVWPANYEIVMRSSERLFSPFGSPLGAVFLGLSAGIGEETFFRGALQPRFRVVLTALLFASGHVQYSLSPAVVEIAIIGLALGWLRRRTNTTTCVLVHSAYNFLNMILMPYWT